MKNNLITLDGVDGILDNSRVLSGLPKKPVDIFDQETCVHCNKDCSCGSGEFVNRYPHYGDQYEGWVCGTCASEDDQELEQEKMLQFVHDVFEIMVGPNAHDSEYDYDEVIRRIRSTHGGSR